MTRFESTGSTVPAWIDERVGFYERRWPAGLLAAALLGNFAVLLYLGASLWTSDAFVYYARP